MKNNIKRIEELIDKSTKILIVSHNSPDPDALSCTTFTYNILKNNYPNKDIRANIEDALFENFGLIVNFSGISTNSFNSCIEEFKPDLIIAMDFGAYHLVSTTDVKKSFDWIKKNSKLIVIDHHSNMYEFDNEDVYINDKDEACALTVYRIFVESLNLKTFENYSNTLLLGIIGDTGHFSYLTKDPTELFRIVTKLVNDGGNIDTVSLGFNRVNLNQTKVFSELHKNIRSNGEYSYSYISNSFLNSHPEISEGEVTASNKMFVLRYIKTIGTAWWGFTIRRIVDDKYAVSFRSRMGYIDTTVFTSKLGGGGHKASSGGKVVAENEESAIKQVIDLIEKYKDEAYANK